MKVKIYHHRVYSVSTVCVCKVRCKSPSPCICAFLQPGLSIHKHVWLKKYRNLSLCVRTGACLSCSCLYSSCIQCVADSVQVISKKRLWNTKTTVSMSNNHKWKNKQKNHHHQKKPTTHNHQTTQNVVQYLAIDYIPAYFRVVTIPSVFLVLTGYVNIYLA